MIVRPNDGNQKRGARFMTLRVRLGLLSVSLVMGTLGAAAFAVYVSEGAHLVREAERGRSALLASFAQSCRDAILVQDEMAAVNAAVAVAKVSGVRGAYCLDKNNRVIAHSDGIRGKLSEGSKEAVPNRGSRGERLSRLTRSVEGVAGAKATIVFSEDVLAAGIRESLQGLMKRLSLVLSGALILGIMGSIVLAQSLARPILRILKGTQALAEGRLDHRIQMRRRDELGQLAEGFDAMAVKLGEVDKMKDDFVSNVTHELRSPLGAIESYANMIAEDARAGNLAEVMESVNVVRNNTTRLSRFINNILDLAKIETRTDGLRRERVRGLTLVQETQSFFAAKAREKGIWLEAQGDPRLELWVDPDKLQQVLTNLVSNAFKFTPEGGRITLSAVQEGDRVLLKVEDTGPGIAPKDVGRIFNRFEQVRERVEQLEGPKGTGLGLAIAKGLVEAHGGKIDVHSEIGRGSVFCVSLPVNNEGLCKSS
ncbi:MAG: HAMP domain-containing histidine kinase [Elusimicrobia bacterium]|nr:HAMP domain-containing histidine kinase [Elusimicrobiota bacterium]